MSTRKLEDETVVIMGESEEKLPEKTESLEHQAANDWLETQSDTDVELGVYMQRPGQRGLAFMFNFFPSDYTKESLQQYLKSKYGGGSYRVQGRANGKLTLNMAVDIAEEPKPDNSGEFGEIKSLIAGLNGNNNNDQMMQMIMQMQNDSSQRQMEMMQAGQQQMMTLLTAILPVIGQKPELPAQTDPIAMFAALKDMMPKQENPTDTLFQGIKLARELSGDSDNGEANEFSALTKMAESFAPVIADKLSEKKPVSDQPALEQNPTPEQIKQKQQEMFLNNINRLLGFAKNNTDPMSVYDILVAMLTDHQWLEITNFLALDDWFQKLTLIQPEVAQYDQWFVRLRNIILADEIDEDNDSGLTTDEKPDITPIDMESHDNTDEVESDATAGTPHPISDDQ